MTEYDGQLSFIENRLGSIETQLDIIEAKGHFAGKAYYEALMEVESKNIDKLRQEYTALQKAFSEAIATGTIEEDSEAYVEMQQQIEDVEMAWHEAQLQLQEYQNQMREMDWSIFERLIDQIDTINSESEFLVDLLRFNESELFDKKTGQFTDKADAIGGLYAVKYNTYMAQAEEYKKKMAELDAEIAKDPANTILLDKKQEYLEAQREAILNANEEKQAIKDLVAESYQKMLEILQKLIDKRKELLQAQKDLYDYENSIKDQNKTITDIEKILSSLENDDSEEALSKRQQLQDQLEKERQNLEEMQYDRWLSDQTRLLDLLYDQYEQVLNERLDNIDGLVTEMIQSTNQNSEAIQGTIESATNKVGYDLTQGMKDIWDTESSEIQNVVSEYNANFTNTMTTTNRYVQEIRSLINRSVEQNAELLKIQGNLNGNIAEIMKPKPELPSKPVTPPKPVEPPKPAPPKPAPPKPAPPKPAPPKPAPPKPSGGGSSGFFVYKKYNGNKSRLNINTSIVDRCKYRDIDPGQLARYYAGMGLGSSSSYRGTYNQNVSMLNWINFSPV